MVLRGCLLHRRRLLAHGLALLLLAGTRSPAQSAGQGAATPAPDSDADGLSDALEQQLLNRFVPHFAIGAHDCSIRPAEFTPGLATPTPRADNGTLYGQATPVAGQPGMAELHFFHLWRQDCGGHGHPLDTEHVAVLLRAPGPGSPAAEWKAVYWYAAAHENTVCDVSQIARAATLDAEDHGPAVWISPGKHASYLAAALCARGCGADRCDRMIGLAATDPVNLGEPGHPMHGADFIESPLWPLGAKMRTSNFPPAAVARLETLPATEIAWFHPGRHPAQGIIAHSSTTAQAMGSSGEDTLSALSLAGASTGGALSTAKDSTTHALGTGYRNTGHALGSSARRVLGALKPKAKRGSVLPPPE